MQYTGTYNPNNYYLSTMHFVLAPCKTFYKLKPHNKPMRESLLYSPLYGGAWGQKRLNNCPKVILPLAF